MVRSWNGEVRVCCKGLYHLLPADLKNTTDGLSEYSVFGPRYSKAGSPEVKAEVSTTVPRNAYFTV